MSAVLWWLAVPAVWCVAMVVREWVHTRQHGRKLSRHQMQMEAHDAAIEAALLGERSLLETRLSGVMSDALRAALGDDYPDDGLDDLRAAGFFPRPFTDAEIAALDAPLAEFEPTPLHDETVTAVFDAELHAIDSPDDLGWTR